MKKLFIFKTESRIRSFLTNRLELQFVFHTGKDGRDGINGDVAIFSKFDARIFITLIHCGICKES